MIRGSSPADKGFKLQFENRLISIYSVCNYKQKGNQGSVILVDGSSQKIRIIRFNTMPENKIKTHDSSDDVNVKKSFSLFKKKSSSKFKFKH